MFSELDNEIEPRRFRGSINGEFDLRPATLATGSIGGRALVSKSAPEGQPPAMAPTTRSGSSPMATACGSGVSRGCKDKS
jgi:hypothetical protein